MRYLLTLILSILCFSAQAAAPDFAFPKKVEAASSKDLKKALDRKDYPLATRSLMNLVLAKGEIDSKSISASLPMISKTADSSNDPVFKAMLTLLQAQIINDIYKGNSYKYDSRKLPLTPLPDDIFEWSGDQFKDKVMSLLDSVAGYYPALSETGLKPWEQVIDIEDNERPFYPTLLQFAVSRSLNILASIYQPSPELPRELLAADFSRVDPVNVPTKKNLIIAEGYKALIDAAGSNSLLDIYARISLIDWYGTINGEHDRIYGQLINLYDKYRQDQTSALIISKLINYTGGQKKQIDQLWDITEEYNKRFPESIYRNRIDEIRRDLTVRSASVEFPQQVAPKKDFTLQLTVNNMPEVVVNVYKIARNKPRIKQEDLTEVVKSFRLKFDASRPFQTDTVLNLSLNEYGLYTAVIEGSANRSYSPLVVSDFYLSFFNPEKGASFITVRDIFTGKPISGVNVQSYKQKTSIFSSVSNKEGLAETKLQGYCDFYAAKGNDRYARPLSASSRSNFRDYALFYLTTSLPIYHPGDSMEFAGILVQNHSKSGSEVIPNAEIKYIISDANRKTFAEGNLKTDEFGRFHASAKLPADGLTGNFLLQAKYNKVTGYHYFMVSDYKLPTFYVTLTQETDTTGKEIIIRGKATKYSGFPVSGAQVKLSVLAGQYRFFYSSPDEEILTKDLTTDAAGEFNFVVSLSELKNAAPKGKIFVANADVTSAAGETRSASEPLSVAKPYFINIKNINNYNLSEPKPLFEVLDIKQKKISIETVTQILKNDSVVLTLKNNDLSGLEKLPTAEYKVRVAPVDTLLADSVTEGPVVMYNPNRKEFDVNRLLWTPANSISIKGNKGEYIIATNRDSIYIEQYITTYDSLISRQWIKIDAGLHHIPFTIPEKIDKAYINLSAVRNLEQGSCNITVSKKSAKKLDLSFTSFRDKSLAGQTEKWTIKTNLNNGKPAEAALIMDIISEAVNSVYPAKAIDPMPFVPGLRVYYYYPDNFKRFYQYYTNDNRRRSNIFPGSPEFQTYGISWNGMARPTLYSRKMKTMASAAVYNDAMVEEVAVEEDAAVETAGAADMNVVREYSAEIEEKADGGVNEDSEAAPQEEKMTYRQSELPLALFDPTLKTGKNGELDFEFTLPDATTTWTIFTTAYTKDLTSAIDRRQIVASKPVMVSTAAPRFLRVGDSADLRATVMNSSGKDLRNVTITAEVLNAIETEVLATVTETADIAENGKKLVSLRFNVPETITGAVFRVKAIAGNYTDGEQASFPILPSSERVVESTPFYIVPDSTTVELKYNVEPGMTASIEFCENAAWSVVQALPGLPVKESTTSTGAALAIFRAAVAEGIIRNNPGVALHLKKLAQTQKADSVIIDNLSRNEDVKLAMLAATPWLQDAMTDSERIARLALLFSKKEINKAYSENINTLAKLVRNGGWCWGSYSEKPSQWATEEVLTTFAMLKQLGFLPDNKELNRMINSSLSWLDSEIARANAGNQTPIRSESYTYIRTFFKSDRIPSGARRTIDATVKYLVENAMTMPLGNKGLAAIILNGNGYPGTASRILESVGEFSTTSAIGEVSWKNLRASQYNTTGDIQATATILEAYSSIQPSNSIIDGIRLWLINEKSRRDWGSSRNCSYAIAAILGSGSNWTPPVTPRTAIRINSGEPLQFTATDLATGYFRHPLSEGNLDIRIDKVGKFPAYGAIYAVGRRQLADIKPVSLPDLSISKELYIYKNGKWEQVTGELKPGDKVKTLMRIKSDVDLSYVMIVNNRPACFEPVKQLPSNTWAEGISFYNEPRTSATNIFVDFLPRGTYLLEEEFNVDRTGTYSSGTAALQSEYAPAYSVRSAAGTVTVIR